MGKKARLRKEKKSEEIKDRKQTIEKIRVAKNPWFYPWRRIDFWVYISVIILLITYLFVGKSVDSFIYPVSNHTAVIKTSMGEIDIKLYDQDAPNTVANFEKLANQGFYNNLNFHRVIKGFMIQGGDPNGDGTGGPGYQFDDEINDHKFVAGTVGMANSGANTNGSQFFIVSDSPQTQLDGKYTAFGEVTAGMDVVKAISEVATDENDKPTIPVSINSIKIN